MDPTPEQIDAVLAHLSAEYDAAEQAALARDYGFWNADLGPQLAKAIRDSKANELRALRAAADRHPERFAELAIAAEKDLRDLAGYVQAATVEQVLKDTAAATVQDAGALAAQGVGGLFHNIIAPILGAIPWQAYAVAGALLVGVVYVYGRARAVG